MAYQPPPLVQEIVANVEAPPPQYVLPKPARPLAAADMPDPIPIVDLSHLSIADGVEETAKLRSALHNWGLFLAVGHEIDVALLDELMKASRGFFQLPLEEKQKYSNIVDGKEFGIEGYGNDIVVSDDQILDWVDRFYLIVEPESARVRSLWPTQPTPFRDALDEYTIKCRKLANDVLRNLAKLLGLSEDYFVNLLGEKAVTYARFNYYPHCSKPDHVFGIKPHSDASIVTVLLVDDDVGGLQVLNNGVWYSVPAVPGSLLVNIGDGIEILSNGIFKSPVHRVLTNAEKERLSLVMFYTLEPEAELEPVPELVDEQRPRLYGETKTKDYIATLFETLTRGTRAIDTVKL